MENGGSFKEKSVIKKLSQLFDRIAGARDRLKFRDNEECFYRGQTDAAWDLVPSLLRRKNIKNTLFQTESGLFYEFLARAKQLHNYSNLDDWDVLFYMRHHAVPTRLLDWSETLAVSLYFATLDKSTDDKTDGCIWLLNPYALNEVSWAGRDLVSPRYLLEHRNTKGWMLSDFYAAEWQKFQWRRPVAIYPPQKSDRMHAQRGWFTIHGTIIQPLNKMKGLQRCWSKIIIPHNLTGEIQDYLQDAGITHHTMFPDLDGLAKYLKEKYNY